MKKNEGYLLAYLGCFIMLINSFFMSIIFNIYFNYKSADAIYIYCSIFITLVILVLLYIGNMLKKTNIILLTILNISLVIIPLSLQYILVRYMQFKSVFEEIIIEKKYFNFMLYMITSQSQRAFFMGSFLLILLAIIIFIFYRKLYMTKSNYK